MQNKKLLSAALACAMMATIGATVAMAETAPVTPNPICTVENCQEVGAHYHDGTLYCDHNATEGHQYCTGTYGCGNGTGNGTGAGNGTGNGTGYGRGYGRHGGGHGGRHCR